MKNIKIVNDGRKNYTPEVVAALADIKAAGGGCLEFEAGEYHFHKEGAYTTFFAVSNNSANDKHIVFPIIGMKDVKVKGGGAEFVFHDITFPFAVIDSERVELSDFSVDTGFSPIGFFGIGKITSEGFYFHIDREKTPYRIERGGIIFKREDRERSGLEHKFSLHGITRRGVQYLFTGECADTRENLPASHLVTVAEERDDGLFLRFTEENVHRLIFSEGSTVSVLLDGGRSTDVILLHKTKGALIKDVSVRRGIGMGIIAQLSEDIEIDGFKTDEQYHGEGATLTADSMHFVNCSGRLDIRGCEITHTMDDAINVHGMYTRITKVEGNTVLVKIGHCEQYFFSPYVNGDIVRAMSDQSFEYTAEMKIIDSALSEDGREIALTVELLSGKASVGELIENKKRMPDLHIRDSRFKNYPHLRISGAGNMIIENNTFECACAALLVKDLAKYWYESGRVKNLVFRNNLLRNCNELGGKAFITIDVDGVEHDATPKIHDHIEISGNRFEGKCEKALIAAGVRELIFEKNEFAAEGECAVVIDGKCK